MDEPADRGYSRAPELEDLVGLCRSLNREGVRYVLIGGFATILHGSARTTKDVDLLVDPSEDNVRSIRRALAVLPDNAVAEVEDADVRRHRVVRVADEIVVDLMAEAGGLSFAEAARGGVETRRLEDVDIPLATKEFLIRTKNTVRESDQSDVKFLRLRIAEERKLGP
jgi:hypothetical protein